MHRKEEILIVCQIYTLRKLNVNYLFLKIIGFGVSYNDYFVDNSLLNQENKKYNDNSSSNQSNQQLGLQPSNDTSNKDNTNSTASTPRDKDALSSDNKSDTVMLENIYKNIIKSDLYELYDDLSFESKIWEPMRSIVFRRLQLLVSKSYNGGGVDIHLKKFGSWVTN